MRRNPTLVRAGLAGGLVLCLAASATGRFEGASRSPVQRGLDYLLAQQVSRSFETTLNGVTVSDRAGNWPQHFHLQGNDTFRIRDVSPFTVSFIHHALSHVVEGNRRPLGVNGRDLLLARLMRQRAVGFLKSFESGPNAPDAGTYGFWPYDADPRRPTPLVAALLTSWLKGPVLGGDRVPLNLPIYPDPLAIPTDADVTSTTYAALLDDADADGGPGSDVDVSRFFADWRDVGVVPRRLNPFWLPTASGAFLTWLAYQEAPSPVFPNDVDLVVNGNVLFALGRYGRLDVPGAAEAIWFINHVVELGIHRDHFQEISEYYPDNLAFHYVVSRAFHEGPVPGLQPAVQTLASDLEAAAITRPDGTAYWDRGAPHLNTAFAVLTLLNAGRDSPLVARAVRYLAGEQDEAGGYDAATFFFGRTDAGQVFEFTSPSFTTAMVLEALVRYELARCGQSSRPAKC